MTEANNPTICSILMLKLIFLPSYNNAPKIAGMLNRKLNLNAFSLFISLNSPVEMVAPDLETPGIIAIACDSPIKMESILFNSLFPL